MQTNKYRQLGAFYRKSTLKTYHHCQASPDKYRALKYNPNNIGLTVSPDLHTTE